MIDVLEYIREATGQTVDEGWLIEDLAVDSLEYLDMLLALDVPVDAHCITVGDLIRLAEK